MAGVSFALADFVTGGPIQDLPTLPGSSWSAMLNRPDSLDVSISLRDPDAKALDLPSSTEPGKTVLIARTDDDRIIAAGRITDREWDEDKQTVSLNATGIMGYFYKTIIGTVAALTDPITNADGTPNAALDFYPIGWSLGTIGKKLIEARLAWPGAPSAPFILPVDEIGTNGNEYPFVDLKSIGSAIDDLIDRVNGPDFAVDVERAPDDMSLLYRLRHGSAAIPRIGQAVGAWPIGPGGPISGLKLKDNGEDIASAAWMTAGKSNETVVASRALNPDMVTLNGYPATDYVDTSHNDVKLQATLDDYNLENLRYAAGKTRHTSFVVRGDASPALGYYRPGDTVSLDPPPGHPWIFDSINIRITSMSGDETGKQVKIGCVILDA